MLSILTESGRAAIEQKIASLEAAERDLWEIELKVARLELEASNLKFAFVPSPNMQQQVQQAQQAGQAPPSNQGANGNAVTPSGLTLDEVAGMIDQGYQATMPMLQAIQQQIAEVRASMPAPEGDGKGGGGADKQLMDRIAALEKMVGAGAAPAPIAGATPAPPPPGAAPNVPPTSAAPPAGAPQAAPVQ